MIWAILIIACLILAGPPGAKAAKITTLVAERASAEYGDALPLNGQFSVRLGERIVTEGEFIREFWIDKKTGRFIANVVTENGNTHRVWGAAMLTVPVPVPNRRILPGAIIEERDLSSIDLAFERLHAFAVTDHADLVGKQVRRMLPAGRPVQRQSVMPPMIISRGDRVSIELKHGALKISAKGKAMEDASLGDEIRVVNLSSNRTIYAIAKGDGVVEVIQ